MAYTQLYINNLSDSGKYYYLRLIAIKADTGQSIIDTTHQDSSAADNENIVAHHTENFKNQIVSSKSTITSIISDPAEKLASLETPLINKAKPISDFMLLVGVSASYFPVTDTLLLSPGVHKSYWINLAQTIYGLPFQLGAATGDNISYNEDALKAPVLFNLSFDYRQYLTNIQSSLIAEYESRKENIFSDFEQIDFEDSLSQYNFLKDTLSNVDYLVYVSQLEEQKTKLLDSINNCYPVDSAYLQAIDSSLAQYERYRSSFHQLLTFQEQYYSIKSKYEDYLQQLEAVRQNISSKMDANSLLALGVEYGLPIDFPRWPLRFKKIQVGAQFINHTPLTIQNYASNGIDVDYYNDDLIIKTAVLTQNWYGSYNVANGTDSLFNLFQNNQTAYVSGVGFGNPDSNHILFTTALISENTETTENESKYSNLLLSLYQKTRLLNSFFLEYEVARSNSFVHPQSIEKDSSRGGDLTRSSALYTKLSYTIPKSKTEIALDQSFIGSSYISIANPFIKPGTMNSGLGFTQSLFKSNLLLSYKVTLSNSISESSEQAKILYHIAQADYQIGKIGSVHMMLSPYQYSYSIEDVTNSENSGASNFVTCYALFNIPIKKTTITTVVNYSNFSTQNNFADTILYLETNTICTNTMAIISGRNISLNTIFYIPQKGYAYAFVNSADARFNVLNTKSINLDCGPKWLDYKTYNDQLGGSVSVSTRVGKFLNWSLLLDKYFEIEHTKENYLTDIFFNTSLSITLN